MHSFVKYLLSSLATVMLLTACGGGDSASDAGAQDKQLNKSTKAAVTAASYQNVVQELYIAYFGRPADPGGLANFESQLLALGAPTDIQSINNDYQTNASIKALVDSFGTSQESINLYGSSTPSQFVTAVFQNVLGRAPASSGLSYWSGAISSGTLSQGNAALSIMAGGLANTSSTGVTDAKLINNRVTVASYFTAQLTANSATAGYAGKAAAAEARALLNPVTSTTDTTGYQYVSNAIVAAFAPQVSGTISTIAGDPGGFGGVGMYYMALTAYSSDNGLAIVGQISSSGSPTSVAVDANGNVYIVAGNLIREVSPNGIITTVAGNGTGGDNGPAISAAVSPVSIAVDSSGNIYFTDSSNYGVRKITAQTGIITTVAGGTAPAVKGSGIADAGDGGLATSAVLDDPTGIAVDASGNIYVGETLGNRIRKIGTNGIITTVAGNGSSITPSITNGAVATNVALWGPSNIAVDTSGNIYVTLASSSGLYKISTSGTISQIATTGNATVANPGAIAVDASGNIYVTDNNDGTSVSYIRKIGTSGTITTVAGNGSSAYASLIDGDGGPGISASLNLPTGLAVDASGNLYIADWNDQRVRKLQH